MAEKFETMAIPTQPDDRAATIIVLDRNERRVATLGRRSAPIYDPIFRDAENEAISLTFRTKSDSEEASYLKQRNMVAVEDPWELGVFRLLEIVEADQISGEGAPQLLIVCDDQAAIELSGDYVDDVRLYDTDPLDALTRLLAAGNSRWKVGNVNLKGTGHTNVYHESVAEGLKKLSEAWGGILRFRVMIEGNRITGRYIDWYDPSKWEDYTGVRWETGKNLRSMKKTVISSDIATAIYPYGRGEELEGEDRDPDADPAYGRRIDISEVVWSTEKGDPVDKPKGQKWIGDPEALQRWGYRDPETGDLRHINHVEIFEDEEDEEELARKGWGKLQTLTQEWATYEAEIVDRSRDPKYAHETTRIGTAGVLIDDNFSPPIEVRTRVVGAEVNLNNKRDLKITLGSFMPGVMDIVRDVKREVEKKVDRGAPITLLDTTVRNLKDRLRNTVGYKYESETLGTLWSDGPYGDPETRSYMQAKGGILALASRWDPVAGEPDWRVGITGDGINADLITTGTLNAELVNIESVSADNTHLIRLNQGRIRTYRDDRMVMSIGGYTQTFHAPAEPYGILGTLAALRIENSNENRNGFGLFAHQDFLSIGYMDQRADGDWYTIPLLFSQERNVLYVGTDGARMSWVPNATDINSAVRFGCDQYTYIYYGDTGRIHFRAWDGQGSNLIMTLESAIGPNNNKGAVLRVRDWQTGQMVDVLAKIRNL